MTPIIPIIVPGATGPNFGKPVIAWFTGLDLDSDQFTLPAARAEAKDDGTPSAAHIPGNWSLRVKATSRMHIDLMAYIIAKFGAIAQQAIIQTDPQAWFDAWGDVYQVAYQDMANLASDSATGNMAGVVSARASLSSDLSAVLDSWDVKLLAGNTNTMRHFAAKYAVSSWGIPSPFADRLTAGQADLTAKNAALTTAQANLAAAQAATPPVQATIDAAQKAENDAQLAVNNAQKIVDDRTAQINT